MPYRPCVFRSSQLGVFQCERHFFQHTDPEQYDQLYQFCLEHVPDRFCPHIDFGFNTEVTQENPPRTIHRIYINCTHTYYARPLKSFAECAQCDFPDKEGFSLG